LPPPPDAGPPTAFCTPEESARTGELSEAEPGLSTDCDGLVPDFPGIPAHTTFEMGTHSGCSGGSSDGEGTLAFGTGGSDTGGHYTKFLVSPSGALADRWISADAVVPQPHGFAVHEMNWHAPAGSALRFADTGGAGPREVYNEIVAIAGVPGGGVVAVERPWNVEHWWVTVHRFDAQGERVAPPSDVLEGPAATSPRTIGVGAATDGSALVVVGGDPFGEPDALHGLWVDPRGRRVTDAFRIAAASSAGLLVRPLLDGSVAVRADGAWRARIRNRSTAVRDPPAWLANLSGKEFQLRKHGGSSGSYVVLFDSRFGGTPRCAPLVEIRAPAGNRCGTLAVPESVQRADVGEDGTLIWLRSGPPCSFGLCCHWRWWTGLLR
jgi:hypothetical protein